MNYEILPYLIVMIITYLMYRNFLKERDKNGSNDK